MQKQQTSNYLHFPHEKLQFDPSMHGTHILITQIPRRKSTVLDVGCSKGYLAKKMKQRKIIVDGVDIDKTFLTTAKKYCRDTFQRDLYTGKLDLPHRKYDYIICADILEHLPRPDLLLLNMQKYLAKNGHILISLPNIARIELRIMHLFGNFDYGYGIMSHDHIRFFTRKSARQLIENAGYEVKNSIPTGFAHKLPFRFFDTLFAFQFIFICQKIQ